MDNDNRDPDGYTPDDIVDRLHRTVQNGVYGIDYTVNPGDKEQKLRDEYIVDDNLIAKILCSLRKENWKYYEFSNKKGREKDIVHFFEISYLLRPRLKEEAHEESVVLYIKITWAKPDNNLFVISFHEDGLFD